MGTLENKNLALKVSVHTIIINFILSLLKFAAGIVAHSGAMLSDGIHSASDVFSTVIVVVGVKMAGKASDKRHPYGHERMECVAAVILSVILFATGLGIGYTGILKIIGGNYGRLVVPGRLALVAAVVSIIVKESMFWYTRAAAKKVNSGALMADAWHHRSDALSSIGSFAGILGARLGFPVLDPVASVVICLFIGKASFGIFMDAIDKMMDTSCDEQTENHIKEIILNQEGVLGIDVMKTRLFGDKIYIDLEIRADNKSSLIEAHDIAQKVHDQIESKISNVKHCMIHVNPSQNES